MAIFDQLSCCHTFYIDDQKSQKKAFMVLSLRRLPMKTEYHQVWISLYLQHVVGYLRWKLLPEIKKMSTMSLLFKIDLQ